MNIPRFTAENSILHSSNTTYRSAGRYAAAISANIVSQLPGVTCTRYCAGTGANRDCNYLECTITGDDPGGWGVNFGGNQDQRNCARCKAGCYRMPAGGARQACLANCDDSIC